MNNAFKTLHWLKRFYSGNWLAIIGTFIVGSIIVLCLLAPYITENDPNKRVARGHQPPSQELIFGSTRSGKDIYSQVLHGGRVDDSLMFLTNVLLVFPQLPLLIVLAAFLGQVGPLVIAVIIGLFSWPVGARIIRSQTLSIRNKEFVTAAEVMGESKWRILLVEILPNLISIVVGMFIGTCLYTIGAQAGLEFLGLGDPTVVTWGTMLFWAQSNAAFLVGAWWDLVVPGTVIAVFGGGLALLNMSVDQISNPKLKTGKFIRIWHKQYREVEMRRQQP